MSNQKNLTCTACSAPCETGVTCNPCEAQRLRNILSNKTWLAVRGTASGDRPGETLADSLRRELAALQA
jgi:hypothetical protein